MSEATLLVRLRRFRVRALMCVQPARPVQKAGVPLGRDSTDILLMSPNLYLIMSELKDMSDFVVPKVVPKLVLNSHPGCQFRRISFIA